MGKVVVARRYPSSLGKKRLEKKRKKDYKRKKQAFAEYEFKSKRKEREEQMKKREEQRKRQEQSSWTRLGFYGYYYNASYWRRVWKSDGFEVDGLKTYSSERMRVFKCEKPSDCPLIVSLYAKMGLHRYNMLQGTNLQLRSVEKYNREDGIVVLPASFYITCVAEDPATGCLVHFQTSSHETSKFKLFVGFYVARPQNTGTVGTLWDDQTAPKFYHTSVPKWPSEDDKKQFYVVQESELEENDWIRLYLELGFVTPNRWKRNLQRQLSDLKIVEVMVETEEKSPDAKLKGFIDATVYIKYHHELRDGSVCKRRAIVRRIVDLRTQRMCLRGDDYPESQTDS